MLKMTSLRVAKRWSRAELARRARMAAGDVGKIEAEPLQPYDSQLRKLARALGLPSAAASTLLADTEPPNEAA
jgi:ribosome-binding protein aMBF1 (putative translation factor)